MSINIKKYTKEQMAQMVEEAAERLESLKFENSTLTEQLKSQTAKTIALRNNLMAKTHSAEELKVKNAILTEQIEQMNGEAINRANELTNLKADAEDLRGKLAATETALGRANAEAARLRSLLEKERRDCYNAEQNAKWAAAHPWRNLWTWFRHKA